MDNASLEKRLKELEYELEIERRKNRRDEEIYSTIGYSNTNYILNNLPDIVLRFDRELRHTFASKNIKEHTGIEAEKYIGKTPRELGFSEELCNYWEDSIIKVFSTRVPLEEEFNFQTPNGRVVFDWRMFPEYGSDGEVKSVLSISRNITKNRITEERYKHLFENMIDGFALHEIILDEKGIPIDYRFLAVNPAFERITGLKSEDIIGKTVLEVLPNTEIYWIESYGSVALTGKPLTFENFSREIDKYFYVTSYRPDNNQFACIFMDITDNKRLEKSCIESTQKFKNYIESSPTPIFISDQEGRYTFANTSACKMLGYTLEEIKHLTIKDLLPEDMKRKGNNNFIELIETGIVKGFQIQLKQKDGKRIDIIFDAKKISENEYIAFVKDISLMKEYERGIIESKEKAIILSKAKTQFLANMSHELRTPLNGIMGMTQLLKGTNLSSEQNEYIRHIDSSGKSLLNIISDILDITLIESRKMKLEDNLFNLEDEVSEAYNSVHLQAIKKGLKINFDYESQMQRDFRGDKSKINQILKKLVSNAVKFTEQGSIDISVYKGNYIDEKLECIIEVKDTGIGIPQEKIDYIFETFTQVDESNTRRYGGCGIGLSITKDLIELMQGTIAVESEDKKGSIFRVMIPLKTSSYSNSKDQEEAIRNDYKASVLVVEDDLINNLVAKRILEKIGCYVESAENGSKALEMTEEKEYDIIFMDLHMPILDGIKTTKILREKGYKSPIIALTAAASYENQLKCLSAGMNDFLAKPFNISDLEEKVFRYSMKS